MYFYLLMNKDFIIIITRGAGRVVESVFIQLSLFKI